MDPKRKCSRRENEDPPPPPLSSSPDAATPSSVDTPFSSFSKSVSLDDWWLIKSDIDYNSKRLAVGGKEVKGTQEMGIFTSAPIVKRYDTFTVETADGITLTFHGFINKHRSHQNGIPAEVSNSFLLGFPYNWEYYADGDFGNKPIPTNSSNNDVGRVFPIRVSFMQLLGALTSSLDSSSIDDVLRRQFNCSPRESNGSIPVDAALRTSSDMRNCHAPMVNTSQHIETLGRHETDNNNRNNMHNEGLAHRLGHDSVGNTIGHAEEAGCSNNEVHDGVHGERSEINNRVIRNHCSSLTVNKNCQKQDEAGQGFQTNPLQQKGVELEKHDNLAKHVATNSKMVDHMPDENERQLNDESTTNSVDLIVGNVKSLSPMEPNRLHLQQCNQQENYAAELQNHAEITRVQDQQGNCAAKCQNHGEKTRVQDVGASEDPVGKVFDSLIEKMSLPSETSFESARSGAQRNGDNLSTHNSAGFVVEVASDGLSPSIRSLLREHHRRKLGGHTPCRHRAERIRVQTLADSEALTVRKVTNRNEADSLPDMTGIVLETAVKSSPNVKERKLIDELTINSADSAVERVSGNLLPTKGDDFHHKPGRRRSGYALRSLDHVRKTGVGNSSISEDSLETKDSGWDTNPISIEMNVPFEKLPDIDAGKVCKAPKKEASQGDQNLSHAHGEKMHVSNSMPLEKKDSGCDAKPISVETNAPFEKLPDIDAIKVCKAPKKKASQGDQNLLNGKTMHEFHSPLTRDKARKLSITSPELLNLKRSSSGRVLVPPVDKWRQQGIIYDMDGSIVAIAGIDTLNPPCKGSKSPPQKKRKLHK